MCVETGVIIFIQCSRAQKLIPRYFQYVMAGRRQDSAGVYGTDPVSVSSDLDDWSDVKVKSLLSIL